MDQAGRNVFTYAVRHSSKYLGPAYKGWTKQAEMFPHTPLDILVNIWVQLTKDGPSRQNVSTFAARYSSKYLGPAYKGWTKQAEMFSHTPLDILVNIWVQLPKDGPSRQKCFHIRR
ncbi:hypothetical protein RRG08_056171 [Elysia crispata]|uniref:Uncharacterized protein n=1 Tax=Elysia crispata TaxID=231223 RepID=A0AAE0Z147_9GAST|nr:hypothetical protein RRG08_056171 [Elysia crispata]